MLALAGVLSHTHRSLLSPWPIGPQMVVRWTVPVRTHDREGTATVAVWYNGPMNRRRLVAWRTTGLVALVMVLTAGVFAGPVPRTDAPTRLLADIAIPARPTALQRDAITLRETYHLPALELCVIDADGIVEVTSDGVRKAGGTDAVTSQDLFHLGSMTKTMTATMLSTLVQEGKLSWDMTMTQAFPAIASVMDLRSVSYTHLTLPTKRIV